MTKTYTDADFDNAQSESGVVHESAAGTDHDDASEIKQGYQYASPQLTTNLLAYHPLEEAGGAAQAQDASANSNALDYNGGSLSGANAPLTTSDCVVLDGTNDFIGGNISVWGGADVYAFAGWFYTESTATQQIFDQEDLWQLLYDFNNSQDLLLGFYGDSNEFTTGVSTGAWHFVYAEWDTVNDEAQMWLDGTDLGTTAVGTGVTSTGNPSYLGQRFDGTRRWDGRFWTTRWYGGASGLSDAEISQLYDVVNTQGSITLPVK